MTDQGGDQAAIVVGVDGSASAQGALEWAAAEASALHRRLVIVHGVIWPLMRVPLDPSSIGAADILLQATADRILGDAEARAQSLAPDVKVTTEMVVAAAEPALLREARHAALLVVGSRGLGGFAGLLVGSVGVAVAAHAACPVVVVHPRRDDDPTPAAGRIVVGVDGSQRSAAAVSFAFQRAARRRVGLTAVRAWTPPLSAYPDLLVPLDRIEAAEHRQLLESVQADRCAFPEVDVEAKLVCDHPGRALIEESAGAGLVVVGSRGHGGFAGLLLGSVSQAVLEHAGCPVAVVRTAATSRERTAAMSERAAPRGLEQTTVPEDS